MAERRVLWLGLALLVLCGAFLAKTELQDVTNRTDGPTFLL